MQSTMPDFPEAFTLKTDIRTFRSLAILNTTQSSAFLPTLHQYAPSALVTHKSSLSQIVKHMVGRSHGWNHNQASEDFLRCPCYQVCHGSSIKQGCCCFLLGIFQYMLLPFIRSFKLHTRSTVYPFCLIESSENLNWCYF